MAELINSEAATIERRLERSLSSTRILAQEIRQNHGLFDGFEEYADEVIATIGGISNLQLAPDGIIKFIHPLKGNEKAIGHNILKDDKRKKEALLALRERNMTLAGPFKLIQGGVGIVGRNPVFILDHTSKKESFWGFASALIFLDELLRVTALDELEKKGYSFELSRIHPDTGKKETFARSDDGIKEHSSSVSIQVPNGQWFLRMSAPSGVSSTWFGAGYILSILISAAITALVRNTLRQPEILKQVVSEKTKELNFLAHHDHLTGLPNRLALRDAVERVSVEYSRYKFSAALIMLDLDEFKQINDLCGHDVGDEVLKATAERIRESIRSTDVAARLGGDEFGILIQHAESVSDVEHVIHLILQKIKEPLSIHDQVFKVSASIGIAFIPDDGRDYMSAYKHADMAMYEAKNAGKNRFCFYNEELQHQAVERINLQQELDRAFKNNEFDLYFQPIIQLSDKSICGYEALIRWNHSEKGVLPPSCFIEVAEHSHKIIKLGYWVVDEACRIIKEHSLDVRISINLSPKQFSDPNLIKKIQESLDRYQVKPEQLELEITESCFIDDFDVAIETMKKLSGLGISLSLDDFGTGYSSLSLLQQLPVQKLKIDRSFVNDIPHDGRDRSIVQGMTFMAHELDLIVVAEGIETSEQLKIIEELGCDFGQGYFFSKPLPSNEGLV
ncbi:EAL domain-containing protein [Pseudoalteromonas sp.]|uniref:bifunctional diguanylate cyclase/phosphodiesterase n=1 Tax=Pseudoalteromonas sp. TaxID=53249 RepID=UPI002603A824|nr:EAL domain-containing protein [Pseudoalteromonas sp.]MCP4586898.1 EAL domain-containing protein [Pseudoalteromonas sp.]